MKQLFVAVCSLLSALLWGGCSVREMPEGGGIDPTTVHTEIVLLPGADMTQFLANLRMLCSRVLYTYRRCAQVQGALYCGSICR